MSHIHEHKDDLLKRVRRIAGQVQAVERALESDADCAKTLHLVAAIRGAVNGLLEQFIDAHAREHVARLVAFLLVGLAVPANSKD